MNPFRVSSFRFQVAAATVQMLLVLAASAEAVTLELSTYIGGQTFEHARDVVSDGQGNIPFYDSIGLCSFPQSVP